MNPRAADDGAAAGLIRTVPSDDAEGICEFAEMLLHSRQHMPTRRLLDPGPDAQQIERIHRAGATAPDHGCIRPWRLILVPPTARGWLADLFVQALHEREDQVLPGWLTEAREKAFRGPYLALCIARLEASDPDIDPYERLVSLGALLQNMMLLAHAMGFGTSLNAGRALQTHALRRGFGLNAHERAICFLSIGTVSHGRAIRARPEPAEFVSVVDPLRVPAHEGADVATARQCESAMTRKRQDSSPD